MIMAPIGNVIFALKRSSRVMPRVFMPVMYWRQTGRTTRGMRGSLGIYGAAGSASSLSSTF